VTAPAQHSFEAHTGEVILALAAPTLQELFAEAGRGLAELLAGRETIEARPASDSPPEQVLVRARDVAALLVAWLDELVYRSEVGKRIYDQIEVEAVADHELRATIRGFEPDHIRTAVKAATFHRLRVERDQDGFRASVVLDV
jgi:SHS2 domain-containing protein